MTAISYPISIPTNKKVGPVTFRPRSIVGNSPSQFTGASQSQKHQGQWWEFDASLPPMLRADAEEWISFFLSLNGSYGRFLFGDPTGETARGIATGTPLVDGSSQTGDQLNIKGFTPNVTGILKKGDYFSIGSGLNTRLHKIIENDLNSDSNGDVTARIWPDIRISPTDGDALDFTAPKGVFKLASNEMPFNLKAPSLYRVSFSGIEAL